MACTGIDSAKLYTNLCTVQREGGGRGREGGRERGREGERERKGGREGRREGVTSIIAALLYSGTAII